MMPISTLTPAHTGALRYLPEHQHEGHELLVGIPCKIARTLAIVALLDTASPWCMLPAADAATLGYAGQPGSTPAILSTRLGTIRGSLERLTVSFGAELGEHLDVDATFFLSSDWHGPAVIGWKGCLERIRFAVDPAEDAFYFGSLI